DVQVNVPEDLTVAITDAEPLNHEHLRDIPFPDTPRSPEGPVARGPRNPRTGPRPHAGPSPSGRFGARTPCRARPPERRAPPPCAARAERFFHVPYRSCQRPVHRGATGLAPGPSPCRSPAIVPPHGTTILLDDVPFRAALESPEWRSSSPPAS